MSTDTTPTVNHNASAKTLVATLPRMRKADYQRFETEVPIFGEQRAIRRKQLQFAGLAGLVLGLTPLAMRRQTWLVRGIMPLPLFCVNFIIFEYIARQLYPSIADNREVAMMRTLWWAKQCSSQWKYDGDVVRGACVVCSRTYLPSLTADPLAGVARGAPSRQHQASLLLIDPTHHAKSENAVVLRRTHPVLSAPPLNSLVYFRYSRLYAILHQI